MGSTQTNTLSNLHTNHQPQQPQSDPIGNNKKYEIIHDNKNGGQILQSVQKIYLELNAFNKSKQQIDKICVVDDRNILIGYGSNPYTISHIKVKVKTKIENIKKNAKIQTQKQKQIQNQGEQIARYDFYGCHVQFQSIGNNNLLLIINQQIKDRNGRIGNRVIIKQINVKNNNNKNKSYYSYSGSALEGKAGRNILNEGNSNANPNQITYEFQNLAQKTNINYLVYPTNKLFCVYFMTHNKSQPQPQPPSSFSTSIPSKAFKQSPPIHTLNLFYFKYLSTSSNTNSSTNTNKNNKPVHHTSINIPHDQMYLNYTGIKINQLSMFGFVGRQFSSGNYCNFYCYEIQGQNKYTVENVGNFCNNNGGVGVNVNFNGSIKKNMWRHINFPINVIKQQSKCSAKIVDIWQIQQNIFYIKLCTGIDTKTSKKQLKTQPQHHPLYQYQYSHQYQYQYQYQHHNHNHNHNHNHPRIIFQYHNLHQLQNQYHYLHQPQNQYLNQQYFQPKTDLQYTFIYNIQTNQCRQPKFIIRFPHQLQFLSGYHRPQHQNQQQYQYHYITNDYEKQHQQGMPSDRYNAVYKVLPIYYVDWKKQEIIFVEQPKIKYKVNRQNQNQSQFWCNPCFALDRQWKFVCQNSKIKRWKNGVRSQSQEIVMKICERKIKYLCYSMEQISTFFMCGIVKDCDDDLLMMVGELLAKQKNFNQKSVKIYYDQTNI